MQATASTARSTKTRAAFADGVYPHPAQGKIIQGKNAMTGQSFAAPSTMTLPANGGRTCVTMDRMRTLAAAAVGWLALFVATAGHAQPARDLTSDAVGSTAGVFRVDESGQATYSIGIAVPPGTAGVTPTLSLDYSSQGSTGVMGKGWSIGGQSSIERCRKSREAGDFVSPSIPGLPGVNPFVTAPAVGFTHEDAFCLDGQRLLLVSGIHGGNNAVYKPELDPWTRVTSKNGNN